MGHPPETDKAVRYISQLDEARCAGRWGDVPELCRKVEKHAPHRRCLTLTARSEARISAYSNQRPTTAASTTSSGLSKIIPSLLTAIDEEGHYVQDAFQATVCLGWLHYVLEEPGLAVARLPKDFASIASTLSKDGGSLSGWSRVCIVKGVFLKGSSHDRTGAVEEAVHAYGSLLPWLCSLNSIGTESSLFKMWIERLLVRLCQLSDQSTATGEYVEPERALQAYRLWAKYCEITGTGTGAEGMARPRRSAWKAYYGTLSTILQHDLPYSPEPSTLGISTGGATEKPNVKLQQRAELKRVESIYERLLLKETHFPKASGSNHEIEEWADAVMENWRFLCGPTWTDGDLGEGGKEAVSRGVLDILYRAASKTFHSTAILRHLFTAHAALAEFELAFKAYDSYVEIITRGKDRAEKSGEEDAGIDDDGTILRTSAEAIRMLCRYGSRKEAEKALEIGHSIEKWCEQTHHIKSTGSEAGSIQSIETAIEPQALAVAYCAIGVSQAQWSRFTYDADARTAIQTKAVQYLRRSLEPRLHDSNNIEALYALALVLAEMRDIAGAIKIVKRALSPVAKGRAANNTDNSVSSGLSTEFGRERKLIPVWHLLALLLTTRSEFSAAEKACEAAFEQFGDSFILFGREEEDATYRSEHLNEVNGNTSTDKPFGIVDQMEAFERSGILQIKMTQLALLEVVEGPNAAVDGCDELLALFARLFGGQAAEQKTLRPPTTVAAPPKSAVGTIRGSIFRSKGSVKASQQNAAVPGTTPVVGGSRPSTGTAQATAAPIIQVTDEHGADHAKSRHHHHLFHHKHEEERPGVTRTPSKLQKRSSNSLRRRSALEGEQAEGGAALPDVILNDTPTRNSTIPTKSPRRPSMSSSLRKSMESGDRPLHYAASNAIHHRKPSSVAYSMQPPKKALRFATPFPSASYIPPGPLFPEIQIRRHKVSLLLDIWIFISGLYKRTEMHEDAKGAVNEALKLVETFEAGVAQESSTSKAFSAKGWGGGRSVERLWADAFSARGELLAARGLSHEAKADFERAVLHYPDHPEAIVGLSNILLDIYAKIIPLERNHDLEARTSPSPVSAPSAPDATSEVKKQHVVTHHTPSAENQISPPDLNRLAARDRAYGLLSTLTKLGTGWDYSEAWYALARAYEESGQIEKAKEVLWWCVELEDTHPVRSWNSVALGGFVL